MQAVHPTPTPPNSAPDLTSSQQRGGVGGLRQTLASSLSCGSRDNFSRVCVCVMDRYHMVTSSRTVWARGPGLSRDQVLVCLLTGALTKPMFATSLSALMKVTMLMLT